MIAADTYGVLLRIDITNNYSYVNIPFPNLVYAFDLDYDRTDDVIYWININNQIKSGSIFGMNIKTVFYLNGIAQSNGIAVDSISRLLFYTDLRNQIIAIINLKDYAHKTVINSGLGKPRAIVIDPINGKLYWIDSGNPPKIETSNYDGTNRQDIVNTGLTSPYGLDVDMHARVLYWCEIGTFKIKRANVDGSNQSLIYQEQVALQGCSIAFYQSYLYFTTWSYRNVIMRIRTDGSGLIFVASSTRINPLGIYVNHNGHLDTLPEDFILVLDESKIYIYRMNINNYTQFSIKIQNGSYPNAIDYDPNAAVMFWTDLSFRHIKSGSIYGNKHTTFGNFNQYAVLSGISLDVISGLLFYTDIGQNFIGVINIDANVTKTIISDDINTPQALVTDPTSGTIYWSSLTKIEKSSYDGTRRQELINTGLNASVDLAVDINVGVMYWCHYNTRKIEVANVDGSNRQVLYKDQATIYKCSIALHQSYLYYIDSSQSALMRIATDGSGMKSVVPSIFHDVMDIHVHSNTTLNQGINGCSNGRGGCSHFCFPQPGGSKVCDCPDDMTLQPDGLSCGKYISPETFLLFLDQRSRCIYIMDICNYKYVTIALKNIYAPYAIGYDPIDRNIYFTDYRFMQIVSVSIDENTQRTMRQLNISPHDIEIAVDAVSRLLFYSDSMISVLSLDGFMQKVVISNITGIPSDLVIDPINGHIYWTTSEYNGKIEKSNYDGTNRQEIINSGLGYLTGLAIDIQGMLFILYLTSFS
ncbi:hypothetical protein ACJMK2_022972 [Sinanodonta woodiana]|uniref:Vitellogenin receptor n=1 Tax=Sinanodonta woodiana TaxID=1069815 RepID=A0ABD3TM09_SINWO